MFGVGTARDVGVGVGVESLHKCAGYREEGRNGAIVHNGVAAEDKWVVIYACHGGSGCGADVSEEGEGGGVGAEGAEVGVVEGGLGRFVEGGEGDGRGG